MMAFNIGILVSVLTLLCLLPESCSLPDTLRVGALFEPEYEGQVRALEWAVQEINLQPEILDSTLVLLDKDNVPADDSFSAQRKVCRMSNDGIAAMFGPVSSLTAAHVQSMCNSFEIPHLQWRWDPRENRDYFSISLYPHYLTLSTAYRDAVKHWGWTMFTILYETNDGLTRLQEVLKGSAAGPTRITVRKLEVKSQNVDYINLLKDLKDRGQFRFIVDCHMKSVTKFLHAALKLRMISELFHYFFTTLDLGLLDLSDYMYGGANITGFRLIDPDRDQVVKVRSSWLHRSQNGDKSPLMEFSDIETETALAYDAFTLFARALHAYSRAGEVNTISLPCDKVLTWRHGNSLLNYMKSIKFDGLSGTIKYEKGERYDFNLDLMQLSLNGLQKVGQWERINGLNYTLERPTPRRQPKDNHYIVSTYLTEPYVTENSSSPTGYSGFCVELLHIISKKLNFTYEIKIQKKVGKLDEKTDTWDGVMGQLINREAQIGIGDLTINLLREKYVDFTKPFLTLGITILYKKPAPKSFNLFSFLDPLSADVWVYMIAAYLCVSFMLFVIARFSPYEWCNPHPCNPDTDEVENQFTVMNCLWFTIGSLMQQGCEIAPRALSTRMVAGMWWLFTLIMISSYTANLAAFLTVERMVSDIKGAEDLASQTKIKYGLYTGGATETFFREHTEDPYKRMWQFMNSSADIAFVKSLDEAVKKVKKGNYAYITESTTVEYVVQTECDLMQVGGLLDSKGYGFATPQGSLLREDLTKEILNLKEKQVIEGLKKRWWIDMNNANCDVVKGGPAGKAAELGVENVGGVFVVLMGGVVIGFFFSICEFVWKARKNAKKDNQTLCSEMSEEFRFAVRCLGTKRKKKNNEDEITDNGLQFMPLTGVYNQNPHGKEVFA